VAGRRGRAGGRRPGEAEGGEWSAGWVGQTRSKPPREGGPTEPDGPPTAEGRRAQKAEAPQDPVQQAKDICLRLLTARPRTRVELAQALTRKGIEPDVAEQVLGRLDEVGLIDDAAFAEVWVRSRHNFQGLSRRALAMELRRKGVADESAAEALAAVDSEAEEDRARQLVRKRLRVLANADEPTKIRKLVGMLARKGYAEGLAYRVVKEELRTSLLDETF
jgi:regulatory protein